MDTGTSQKPEDGRLFPGDEPPMIIEPLKAKRLSRTVREIEALVVGLQVALVTEPNGAKEEILYRIGNLEESVGMIARQAAREGAKDAPPSAAGEPVAQYPFYDTSAQKPVFSAFYAGSRDAGV